MRHIARCWSNTYLPFIGIIILLPFILFWRWVLKGEVLFWGTSLLQFWPWHSLVKTALLNGEWPLWNPLLGNGTPLLANLQSAVFYPPNLLYLILPVEHALTLSVVIHLILAGLFMYLYTQQLGLLPFAAVISALAYMFSGYIIGRSQFITMINSVAWIPLLLLLSDKFVIRRGGIYILWLALALAVQFLAGHAQLWFYSLWLIGPYIVFRSWQVVKSSGAGDVAAEGTSWVSQFMFTVKAIGFLALAVGISVLIAAVQILPTAEFVMHSVRSSGAERTFALTYSYWPWRLITLLAPDFFGHPAQGSYWGYANFWEDHAYLGVMPLILAVVAIGQWITSIFRHPSFNRPKIHNPQSTIHNRVVPFFAALIPITLVLAMGWNTPVYLWVFDTIPGFGFFQAPARLLIWYTVAMAVLAGIGAQQFKLTYTSRGHWRRLITACLALTAAGFAATIFVGGRSLTFLTATQNTGILLIISISLLLLHPHGVEFESEEQKPSRFSKLRHILAGRRWQWAVIIFVTIDLLLASWSLIPTQPATVYTQPIVSAEIIKNKPGDHRFYADDRFVYNTIFNQYFRFKTFGPAQLEHWLALKETLIPNLGVYAHLASVNNDDPLVVGRWKWLINQVKRANPEQQATLLALTNSGFFIGPPNIDPHNNSRNTIYETEFFSIQQISNALPRAYFVSQIYQAKNRAKAIARLTDPDFDPHQEVVIMEEDATSLLQAGAESPSESRPVPVRALGPHQLQLQVVAPVSGFVVLVDTFYPGWRATIDDQNTQILPANLAFRAVAVEAGQHNINFYYQPLSFTIGLWTSTTTCLIIVLIIGYRIFQHQRLSTSNLYHSKPVCNRRRGLLAKIWGILSEHETWIY